MESNEDTNPVHPSKNDNVPDSSGDDACEGNYKETGACKEPNTQPEIVKPRKKDILFNCVLAPMSVGVFTLIVYSLTMFRTTAGGDAGEILAVSCSGGILHPPGYPLVSIIGQFAAALPGSAEPAWRIGLFLSAIPSAGAATMLCANLLFLTDSVFVALICSLLYGFSSLVWTYATTVEVFAINNFILSVIFLLATLFERASRSRDVGLATSLSTAGAFFIGLGLCNQHTLILAAAPVMVWALCLACARGVLTVGLLLRASLALAAGLSPYIYLPLAASAPDRPPGAAPAPRWRPAPP